MRLEIILVFLLEAADSARLDLLEDAGRRPRRSGGLGPGDEARAPGNSTMAPEEVEVAKGAIQRLLGHMDLSDHVTANNPTRSPTPPILPPSLAETTALTEFGATDPSRTNGSSYTQLLAQLIDYADKVTENPPRPTLKGQLSRPPHLTRSGLPARRADASTTTRALHTSRRRTLRSRTRVLTRRDLCTHEAKVCATMCFDDQNYRIPCPNVTSTSPAPLLDIVNLLKLLEEKVEDYDTNITEKFRQLLEQRGFEACPPTVTTELVSTSTDTDRLYDYEESNKTGALISKCFVCGLEDGMIPMNAHCSDAFAGEFLPMTPVDASARGHLASYRKYCRFMDMPDWYVNGTDGRTAWGRWTGGCAVRWVDISGVYTQRACRSRHRPALGHHFLSKRMAKLELALRSVDNGCIISPMASLVPFSRGVSLYARFHACVCTGNWCNRAPRLECNSWMHIVQALLLLLATHS